MQDERAALVSDGQLTPMAGQTNGTDGVAANGGQFAAEKSSFMRKPSSERESSDYQPSKQQPRRSSKGSLPIGLDTMKDVKDAMEEIRNGRKERLKRSGRVESSWEDVPSSDESSSSGEESSLATRRQSSHSITTEHEDQWEDEEPSDLESDSGLSSATEAATAGPSSLAHSQMSAGRANGGGGDDDTIKGTPQKSDRIPRRNSAQRALREYRKSKLALMKSETDNFDRFSRLVNGGDCHGTPSTLVDDENEEEGGATPFHERHEIRRTDTMDLLQNTEPFTRNLLSEHVDQAEGAGRATDIHFAASDDEELDVRQTLAQERRSSGTHSRKHSSASASRSPRLPPRRLSASPATKHAATIALAPPVQINPPVVHTQAINGSSQAQTVAQMRDQYASDPGTPVELDLPPSEAATPLARKASESPERKRKGTEALPNAATDIGRRSDVETPRRSSKHIMDEAYLHPHATPATAYLQPPSSAKLASGKRDSAPSAEAISAQLDRLAEATPPFSLWDYLKEEITANDFDSTQEMKWERVTNFIAIPFWMEKIMLFGFFVCLDSFLYTFTILPLRFMLAVFIAMRNQVVWLAGGPRRYLSSSHKCDILKTVLILLSCFILSRLTDASQMYHSVRGQDVVKLYVIFNVLEIADRLCCSFGQDLLDSLFSRSTLARRKDGQQPYLRPLGFFALSLLYVLAHTLVLLYQLVTLNVAINSYDNALLTLLLSNQFVEIKGSVFKKFEKENLFQLTCADIVERFQLTLMLCSIGLRNLIEVAGAAGNSVAAVHAQVVKSPDVQDSAELAKSAFKAASPLSAIAMLGPLPTSFTVFPSFSLLETIFTPVCIVLASEFLVDWLKHAFITKFNHIRPAVYGRFMDVLCRDLILAGPVRSTSRRRHTFVDQSPVVSRRLGFAAVPLACLLVRMTSQVLGMLHDDSHFDECAVPDLHRQAAGVANGSDMVAESMRTSVLRVTRRPFEAMLGLIAKDPGKALDVMLFYIWSASAWILTITIAWVFLIALKLLLGTNLSHFAARRYATMAQREKEEELNARNRQPIGVDKEEMAYDAKIAQMVDRGEDDASRISMNGAPLPAPSKHSGGGGGGGGGGKGKSQVDSLMDVSRYTMVRSRIW